MAVRRGAATPSKIYRGTAPVQKVMRGTVEVWSASLYPMAGTWGPVTPAAFDDVVVFSHVIEETGTYILTIAGSAAAAGFRINGGTIQYAPQLTVALGTGNLVEMLVTTTGGTHSGTWSIEKIIPVVQITGTSSNVSRNQFRQACIDHGTTYQTVQALPFRLDTSQATNMAYMFNGCTSLTRVPSLDTGNATIMAYMFYGCSALTTVPDMDTAKVTNMTYMFNGCSSLTDGNVRLIGKHPSVVTSSMIAGSGLTREPFYDANGNPI